MRSDRAPAVSGAAPAAAAAALPWAIDPDVLPALLARGSDADARLAAEASARQRARLAEIVEQPAAGGAVCVLPLAGVISHRASSYSGWYSFLTTCEDFAAAFDAAIANASVAAVVVDVNSPGGSTDGVAELTARVRAARGVKPVVAVANAQMGSAAYWIASAADEVVVTPSGSAGSIGVFAVHMDLSAALKEQGVKPTLIRAGKYKAEDLPYFPLSDAAREAAEARIGALYEAFVADVAANRGATPAAVRAGYGQGRMLPAAAAVAAGLADRVATLEEVLEQLAGGSAGTAATALRPATRTIPPRGGRAESGRAASAPSAPVAGEGPAAAASTAPATGSSPARAANAPPPPAPAARSSTVEPDESTAQGAAAGAGGAAGTTTTTPAPNGAPNGAGASAGADRRVEGLSDLADAYGAHARLPEWIRTGKSVAEARAEVRAHVGQQSREAGQHLPVPGPGAYRAPQGAAIDQGTNRPREFVLGRALQAAARGDWRHAGFEREYSQALAQAYKYAGAENGFLVPTQSAAPDEVIAELRGINPQAATHVAGTPSLGGSTVATELRPELITLLRNKSVVMRLGPRVLAGLVGNLSLPRKTGSGTATWRGESSGAVAGSNMTFDQVQFAPHEIKATEAYSRQFFVQSVLTIDQLIKEDISENHALLFDYSALHGDGTGNGIVGLYNQANVRAVAFAGPVTYDGLVDMETAIDTANALEGAMAYITTPGVKGRAKKTQQFAGTNGTPLWTGTADEGEMNGYRAISTNQVRSNLGAGANEHGMVFGAIGQAYVGQWGAMEVIVDPYSRAKESIVEITSSEFMDFQVRHGESFAKATGLTK